MTEPLIQQQTIKYKTWIKESLVLALRAVFASHPDELVRENTTVDIDFGLEETQYPTVIVRFYERSINNAGVGHVEYFKDPLDQNRYVPYSHYLYQGDIEFAIYALSSLDRDVISDSIVQTLTMGQLEAYTHQFYNRIYAPGSVPTENEGGAYDASIDHMINLNSDQISGFGETQVQVPWMSEDQLVYQTSYRINIHGEFYSRTPVNQSYDLITGVQQYPFEPDIGETTPNPNPEDPAPWYTPGPEPL